MRVLSCYHAIPRQWRTPKTLIAFFAFELALTVAALALYGIAAPDLYRTRLWQEGSNHGWNSNPNELAYAAANYRPVVEPLPWSQFITNYNVVISVLSLFIALCKMIMYITHTFPPLLSLLVHLALVALYAVSIHAQAAPDMSSKTRPQPGAPWYITKSCGPPVAADVKGYCMQAKGAFAVTVLLCALFLIYSILSVISLIPTREQRQARHSRLSASDIESTTSASRSPPHQPWEMSEVPPTPGTTGGLKSPTTPRTMAFNTLSGKGKARASPITQARKQMGQVQGTGGAQVLPLRHHISMGDEVYKGPSER